MFRARRLFSRELAWSCFLATCAFFLVVGVSTGCPVCALFCLVTDVSAAFITEEPSIWRPSVSGATILSLQDLHSVAVRILQRSYDVEIYFLLKMPSDLTLSACNPFSIPRMNVLANREFLLEIQWFILPYEMYFEGPILYVKFISDYLIVTHILLKFTNDPG